MSRSKPERSTSLPCCSSQSRAWRLRVMFASARRPAAVAPCVGIVAVRLRSLDRGEPGTVECFLVLLALIVGKTVVAVRADPAWHRGAAALAGGRRPWRLGGWCRGATSASLVAG